jgi:hypothetical protein
MKESINRSQKRAIARRRGQFGARAIVRYEVWGLRKDRELIRKVAKKLGRGGAEAAYLRREIECAVGTERQRGGLWGALRRSPFVGADLNLEREFTTGRDIDL